MPGSIRLFVDSPLSPGAVVGATAGQAHYLGAVMRRAVGDAVALFNGRDGEWSARLDSLRKERASFAVVERTRPQAAESDLWLVFAPLKRDATDLVIQKATELGASRIVTVLTARTNAARINEARLGAIAIEAAEQCERLTVPDIVAPLPLRMLLGKWPGERPLHAALERSAADPLAPTAAPAALLIGPEGGFTDAELDELRAHAFVRPASLGPRILRAETAAIVGLALLQAHSRA